MIAVLVLVVVLTSWSTKKSDPPFAPRGKVVADGGASLLKMDINRAAFFNYNNNDSKAVMEGTLCVLNDQ